MPTPGIRIPLQTMLAIQRLFLWLLIHRPPLEGLSLTTLGQASTVICVYPA